MKKLLFILAYLFFAAPASADSNITWALQTSGDNGATSLIFVPTGVTKVLLTPILASEWDCTVTETSTTAGAIKRAILCFRKDTRGLYTSAVSADVSCRLDGTSTVAQGAFLKIFVVRPTQKSDSDIHNMSLYLGCTKLK